jgi:hypothetical protein
MHLRFQHLLPFRRVLKVRQSHRRYLFLLALGWLAEDSLIAVGSDEHFIPFGTSLLLGDLLVVLNEDLVAVGVVPTLRALCRFDLGDLLFAIVLGLPLDFVDEVESEDKKEHAAVDEEAEQKADVLGPDERVVGLVSDDEAFVETEHAAQSLDVDQELYDCEFGRGRQLLLYRGYQSDVPQDHRCNSSDSARELGVLEKNGQTEQGQHKYRQKDRYQ